MKPKLADLRKSYEKGVLSQKDVMNDPIQLFQIWFNEAKEVATIDEANAMSLSTLSTDGFPRARVVLLKDYSKEGFVFLQTMTVKKENPYLNIPKLACLFIGPVWSDKLSSKGQRKSWRLINQMIIFNRDLGEVKSALMCLLRVTKYPTGIF